MASLLIYSKATGRPRRLVIDYPSPPQLGPGEASMPVPDNTDVRTCQALVTQATGLVPSGDRFVAIDANNKITAVVICDIACGDGVTGCTLMAHDQADPSWAYEPISKTLIAPLATVSVGTKVPVTP